MASNHFQQLWIVLFSPWQQQELEQESDFTNRGTEAVDGNCCYTCGWLYETFSHARKQDGKEKLEEPFKKSIVKG